MNPEDRFDIQVEIARGKEIHPLPEKYQESVED